MEAEPDYFSGPLPEEDAASDQWVPKWQNCENIAMTTLPGSREADSVAVKHILKSLNGYFLERTQQSPHAARLPDLKAVAQDYSAKETNKVRRLRHFKGLENNGQIKLLKLVLFAAINSSMVAEYAQKMLLLSTSTQEDLKQIIEEVGLECEPAVGISAVNMPQMQNSFEEAPEASGYENDPLSPRKLRGKGSEDIGKLDPGFAYEEQVSKLVAENEKLLHEKKGIQRDLQDLHDRHARLQENHVSLSALSGVQSMLIRSRKHFKTDLPALKIGSPLSRLAGGMSIQVPRI